MFAGFDVKLEKVFVGGPTFPLFIVPDAFEVLLGLGGQFANGSNSSKLEEEDTPGFTCFSSLSPDWGATPEDARGGHSMSTAGHDTAVG